MCEREVGETKRRDLKGAGGKIYYSIALHRSDRKIASRGTV